MSAWNAYTLYTGFASYFCCNGERWNLIKFFPFFLFVSTTSRTVAIRSDSHNLPKVCDQKHDTNLFFPRIKWKPFSHLCHQLNIFPLVEQRISVRRKTSRAWIWKPLNALKKNIFIWFLHISAIDVETHQHYLLHWSDRLISYSKMYAFARKIQSHQTASKKAEVKKKKWKKRRKHSWTRGIVESEIFELFVNRFNFKLNAKQCFQIIKLKSNASKLLLLHFDLRESLMIVFVFLALYEKKRKQYRKKIYSYVHQQYTALYGSSIDLRRSTIIMIHAHLHTRSIIPVVSKRFFFLLSILSSLDCILHFSSFVCLVVVSFFVKK